MYADLLGANPISSIILSITFSMSAGMFRDILLVLSLINNEAMIRNLVKKASARSPTVYDSRGQPSYKRHNRESTTIINPSAKTVATIYPLKKSEAKRYGIDRTHLMTETELRRSRASSSKPKARRTVKRSASSRVSVKRTAVKRTSTGRSSGKRRSR